MKGCAWFVVFVIVFVLSAEGTSGDKWNLHLYENSKERNAVCNDGTPAGFYVRQVNETSSRSKIWNIHLSGGFWCWDAESCQARWDTAGVGIFYMSSSAYRKLPVASFSGIFDVSETNNPYFYNVNSAIGLYCSSDSWTGTSPSSENGTPWNFFGHYNVLAMLEDLWESYSLPEADLIVISGCSAGGMGQISNVDRIREWIHQKNSTIPVKGIVDAGWFLDLPLYSDHGNENSFNAPIIPTREQVKQGAQLWQGATDTDCMEFYKSENELWKCYLGQYAYHFIHTENFYHQELYDAWQISYNFGEVYGTEIPPWNATQTVYANDFAAEMRRTLQHVTDNSGLYSPECLHHCSLLDASYWEIRLESNELSLSDTFGPWFYNATTTDMIDGCSEVNCSLNCPDNGMDPISFY